MDNLALGMDAAIRAPGARDRDLFRSDRGQRRLERILHRSTAGLRLPAKKTAAVVLDSECVAIRVRAGGRGVIHRQLLSHKQKGHGGWPWPCGATTGQPSLESIWRAWFF